MHLDNLRYFFILIMIHVCKGETIYSVNSFDHVQSRHNIYKILHFVDRAS